MNEQLEWVGVDLDGTLAEFNEKEYFDSFRSPETIGKPILKMVKKIKQWRSEGKRIKIFTARASLITALNLGVTSELMETAIHEWLELHLGFDLEVTNQKDCFMIELWDDINLVQVKRNTGEAIYNPIM